MSSDAEHAAYERVGSDAAVKTEGICDPAITFDFYDFLELRHLETWIMVQAELKVSEPPHHRNTKEMQRHFEFSKIRNDV